MCAGQAAAPALQHLHPMPASRSMHASNACGPSPAGHAPGKTPLPSCAAASPSAARAHTPRRRPAPRQARTAAAPPPAAPCRPPQAPRRSPAALVWLVRSRRGMVGLTRRQRRSAGTCAARSAAAAGVSSRPPPGHPHPRTLRSSMLGPCCLMRLRSRRLKRGLGLGGAAGCTQGVGAQRHGERSPPGQTRAAACGCSCHHKKQSLASAALLLASMAPAGHAKRRRAGREAREGTAAGSGGSQRTSCAAAWAARCVRRTSRVGAGHRRRPLVEQGARTSSPSLG